MPEPEVQKKETKLEKDFIWKIVLGLILMWAFGFAWGFLVATRPVL